MKRIFSLTLIFLCILEVSAQRYFRLELNPQSRSNLPALQSNANAVYHGKWFYLGGRTNGLHGFQLHNGFPFGYANTDIFIYDYASNRVASRSTSELPSHIREPLSSTNMQFIQEGNKLYYLGGYGFSDILSVYRTYPSLLIVNLDTLEKALTYGDSLYHSFQYTEDTLFKVAGGALIKQDSVFTLVFGHNFDGQYQNSDTSTHFIQRYTNQIRHFQVNESSAIPFAYNFQVTTDTENFHRRDYNLVPQIFEDGKTGHTAFSGVFRYHINLPYLDCIDVMKDSVRLHNSFQQKLNNYTCAVMPVFDSSANFMHSVFFGGMAQYYWDSASSSIRSDVKVPFVNTVARVTRDPAGNLDEYRMPVKMPGLSGSNAYFIPADTSLFTHQGVLMLNRVTSPGTLVGYIIGGIQSPNPNISETDPELSSPYNNVIEVRMYFDSLINTSIMPAPNPWQISVFPNPARDMVQFEFSTVSPDKVDLQIVNEAGEIQAEIFRNRQITGKDKWTWKCNTLAEGNYFYILSGAHTLETGKLIIQR